MIYTTMAEKNEYQLRVSVDTESLDGWLDVVKITDEGEQTEFHNNEWIREYFGDKAYQEANNFKNEMVGEMVLPESSRE